MSKKRTVQLKITKDLWSKIGEMTGWLDIGFGGSKFKFYSGPGAYCVCPFCGYAKKSVRMMPCEKLTCPMCGKQKMEQRYIEHGKQMSPTMRGL